MPACGALISVRASLTSMSRPCARAKARSALAMASACRVEFCRAAAERAAASRRSKVSLETLPLLRNDLVRSKLLLAATRLASASTICAFDWATTACARAICASFWVFWTSSVVRDRRARTCPALTRSPSSARSSITA